MQRKLLFLGILSPLLAAATATISNVESASRSEVIAKVHEASALIQRLGDAAFDVIGDQNSNFVWKDTYVFAVNCEADRVMANAAFPNRVGGDIKQHLDYAGKQYGLELCQTAMRPEGGFIDYVWLRPGDDTPRRKISFVISVPGTPYQVGAGVYDKNTYAVSDEINGVPIP